MEFCNYEGWGPISTQRYLDFTLCFENSVLLNIPKFGILLFGIPRIFKLYSRIQSAIPLDYIFYLKIILSLVLTSCGLWHLLASWLFSTLSVDDLISASTDIFVLATATALIYLEHLRSKLSSTIILFFYLSYVITLAIYLRTLILSNTHPSLISICIIQIISSISIFVLELIPKSNNYYSSLQDGTNSSPDEVSNIFSRLTFSWMDPLMKLGYKKVLSMSDLWNLKIEDTSEFNSEKFQNAWAEELLKSKPSLLKACAKAYGWVFLSAAIFKLCQDALGFIQPQFLKAMMEFAKSWSVSSESVQAFSEPEPIEKGFLIAISMLLTAILQTLFLHQYFHVCLVTGMRVRSAIITAVYRKALRLSNSSRQSSTVGEIVNLMSVDASRLMELATYLHILWSGPFQICLAIYFLYDALGAAIFGGVGVMLLMIPVNAYLASLSRSINKSQMLNKDNRTRLMDELLNGIRVIKLYAWENAFLKKINNVREAELGNLKRIGYLSAMQTFTWSCTPFLVSFTSFGIYSYLSDEPITSTKIFVSIALFNLLQFPLAVFPSVITAVVEASVSFGRLYKFLMSEELDMEAITYEPITPFSVTGSQGVQRICMQNGSFKWNPKDEEILKSISLTVNDKELVAIVGSVGSGKSSVMSAILGEMYKTSGTVFVRGSIAYVPQNAWIMNATVKENILFGRHFDDTFYRATISACGLLQDFDQLPAGDETEIGERGINLSGGQKQRISIARAVYSQADIYLFDDSLSAVDAHVGRHIFDKVIGPKGLLKTKSRLLVTNAINFLPNVDMVIMLAEGQIVEADTYSKLMDQKAQLYNLMQEYGKGSDEQSYSRMSSATNLPEILKQTEEIHVPTESKAVVKKDSLIVQEETAKGSVSWDVYKNYAKSCSYNSVAIFIIIAILSQVLNVGQNVYLAAWASSNDLLGKDVDPNIGIWLGGYGMIGVIYSLSVVTQVIFVWIYCGIRSARLMHNNMLKSVIRLPQSFFDTTPLGRILNRFSKDQYTIDEVLPRSFQTYFRVLFSVVSVLAVNAIGSPLYIVFAIPLGFLYMHFQRFYLCTSRELQRLDSTSRSPIFAHFQETLGGVSSIRAYKCESRFISINESRIDFNQKAYYPSISSNRWLAVRLEFIGALVVFGSALFAVLTIYFNGVIPAGIIGLMLTYSLSITQTLNWMVRQSCEIETNIVSVERIKEYTDLAPEAPYTSDFAVPQNWPENGTIEFKDYSTRYREGLDLVLGNLKMVIKAREKVGIVGRTGAGKSSLTLALFRLIEASSGSIMIDSIDISKVGLYDLRSRLTIIPQDPVLFSGTIRDNLDPFSLKTDIEVWESLEAANLKDYIRSLNGGLSFIISQGGENFSVGQRQLICLARAILRNTHILVLDEATAAIDVETDNIIQKTIRDKFRDATVFTIAHRINTVMDNDRILVLDKGRVAEFDSPKILLKNKMSMFYGLAKEAGLVNKKE